MSTITTSILGLSSLNAVSAEAARIAAAERGSEEVVANHIKQAAEQAKFAVGTTITARYQYKVGEDGSLVPLQTQVTTTTAEDALRNQGRRSQRQAARDELQDRRPRFSDLLKPKPELSPTDELALFANPEATAANPQSPLPNQLAQLTSQTPPVQTLTQATAEASDENGDAIKAELLTPEGEPILVNTPATLLSTITARAQFAVAGLYARNNDVVYNVTPLAQFAA